MDPHTAERVSHYARRWQQAAHGQRQAVLNEALAELGVSRPTFYKLLAAVRPSGRKRRADAGGTGLGPKEADAIAAYLREGVRGNGKPGRTLRDAVRVLRANGTIQAVRTDPATGECKPLSESAIRRALLAYGMHPEQLNQPAPHGDLSYPHPNHTHQVDSSVGVIYYLKDGSRVCEMDGATHYKNKPWNVEAVSEWRVIRYVLIDMCSGVVRFQYFPQSESARHTVEFLAWAWAPKASPHDPFHGVPKFLYCDNGIANALVRRFCERLGVQLVTHRPRNARATGGVEGAHNYAVEMPFEHGLRDVKQAIAGFDDLNRIADHWQLWWNADAVHRRHQMTRFAAWMHITPGQLQTTCDRATLLTLATENPKDCRVRGNLTVQFKSRVWDVKGVPGVAVNGKVAVHWHPFADGGAMAVVTGADGREAHLPLPEVTGVVDPHNGQWGFLQNAAEFGKEYKPKPDTRIDENRKRLRLVASGEATLEADEQARKRKGFAAFGGGINPYAEAERAELPAYLPRRGTALDIAAPQVEPALLTPIQAAKTLKPQLERRGVAWTPAHLADLQRRGDIAEADLPALLEAWACPAPAAPKLAVVR